MRRRFTSSLCGAMSSWILIGTLTGVVSQFSPPSGPWSDIEFSCVGNSDLNSFTHWRITPGGGETPCLVPHNQPEQMQRCGPDRIFTSSVDVNAEVNESTNSAKPSSLLNNRYTREVTHPTFHRTRVEKWTRPRGPASTHARR